MEQHGLALHETLDMHEILNFKAVCMTKSQTMQALVTDGELKSLMQLDAEQSARAVGELQNLLSRAKL
jgi:similar to spore coat protein